MKRLLGLVLVGGWAGVAAGAPPEIAQVIDPTRAGQTILLSGEGFDRDTVFRMWVPQAACAPGQEEGLYAAWGEGPALPRTPPAEAVKLEVVKLGAQYAALEMPQTLAGFEGRFYGPYLAVLWAGNGQGWGLPYMLNRACVYFCYPRTAAPGEAVRLFGRNFTWYQYELDAVRGATTLVALRRQGEDKLIRPAQQDLYYLHRNYMRDYHTQIVLPEALAEGDYEVRVHSGSGGPYGWSRAVKLTVRKPAAWPSQVFRVAAPGAGADHTEAIGQALEAAGKNGGGVVLLGPGIYTVRGTLTVGPQTVLRGAGRECTTLRSALDVKPGSAMIVLRGPCAMEDLGVELLGQVPRGAGVQLAGPQVAIRRCRFKTEHYLTHGAGVPLPNTILGELIDGEITHGDFTDLPHLFLPLTVRSRLAFNTAQAWHFLTGGSYLGLGWGSRDSIFEHNRIAAPRGAGIGAHRFGRVHNFMVGNLVERTLTCDGEAYLLEECNMQWYARPGEARFTRDTVTIPGAAWKPSTEQEPGLRDFMVAVTQGRGVGQYRLIVSNTADTLHLAQPWRIVPDASSACIVMAGSYENVLVNNQAFDCNGCPPGLFYAGAMGTIVDGHIGRNTGSPYLWSTFRDAAPPAGQPPAAGRRAWNFYLKPDYFNQFIRSQWQDSTGVLVCARRYGHDSKEDVPGIVQMGTRVSHCLVTRGNRPEPGRDAAEAGTSAVWVDGPVRLVAVENNTLADFDVGVRVSRLSHDVLVRRNLLVRLGRVVDDAGRGTLVAPLADQMYYVDIGIGWHYPRPDGKNVGVMIGPGAR